MTEELHFATGDKVRYHPIIGGDHDGRIYTVVDVGDLHGRPVAWLRNELCCVSVAALSRLDAAAEEPPR